MASRTPIPTETHILRGNPGHKTKADLDIDRQPKSEIVTVLPPPPDYFGEYAAKEWNRTGPLLIQNKLLQEADIPVFAAYCMNIELLIQAQFEIKKNGMLVLGARGKVRNPAIAAFGQASTAIRGFATEFGLTPSARSRIKLPADDSDILGDLTEDDDENDFSKGI